MKKLLKSSQAMLMMILAGIAIISASSYSIDEAMAFPHASLIIDPKEPDANDIRIVVGHTNEPSYGKLPGIHDGKHNLEVDLSDDATTLPIPDATLFADKYYFKNIESFKRANSLQDADAVQLNVSISAVFGQSGTFYNRQVIDPGIYGYTIRGVINYYDVADVPIKGITKFCSIPGVDLTKFDSPKPGSTGSWTGSYGCPQNIKSIFFPPASKYPDNYNNYPPKYPQYDDGFVNYQQQYDDNNNNYGYVNEDYQQSTKENTNYDDKRDNSRDDKKNDNKEYDNNYNNNNNNYDYPYSYGYTDDNGKYGNEYASYEE